MEQHRFSVLADHEKWGKKITTKKEMIYIKVIKRIPSNYYTGKNAVLKLSFLKK